MAQGAYLTGRVTRINSDRRYFFIVTEQGQVFFAHQAQLHGGAEAFGLLRAGDWVSFHEYGPKKGGHRHPRATEVYHAASILAAEEPTTEYWPPPEEQRSA